MNDDPLDQLNRAVISIVALLIAFAALVVVLVVWGAPGAAIGRIEDLARFLDDHDSRDAKIIATLGALVVVMLMLSIIVIEVTPSPVQRMRVRNVQAGDVRLTTTEIAARIEAEAMQAPNVAACRAVVTARGNRISVMLDLQVDAGADLATTANEACRRAHELVEQRMGLKLTERPRARLQYRELRLKDGASPPQPATGWERPHRGEGAHDERGSTESPEEAQA